MENKNLNTEETANSDLGDVRRSAYFWWGKLDNDIKVKYASECLDKKGKVVRYNNDGYMIGIDFNDIIGMFQHYA
jgi:hypothetical protein